MPGSLSQRSFWTSRSSSSPGAVVILLLHEGSSVEGGGSPGSRVMGDGEEPVVDGQVGLGQRDGVELVVAEAQGGGLRNESALVAHDVLDVLGADVAGLHDLVAWRWRWRWRRTARRGR